ncbi:MAG TPA: hypothetical protein VHG08_28685 [Longimicrobium sp.]|nr:hypothetical protein [Longimicrobium sp.]
MTAHPPPDADTLASALAGRYAGRWARRVVRRAEGDGVPAPWFVDGFAGADLQRAALRSVSIQPAAVAAVQALDAATDGGARVVLVEEDPGLVARLVEELHAPGAGARVRMTADPATAAPGDVTIVEAPFAAVAARLAERIGDEPALVRLAPLTARVLPWPALQAVAALGSTDLLFRVPHEDFAKQARFTGPLADLPPHLRRVVEGCSAMLADSRHGWIAAWREAARGGGPDAALGAMVDRLHDLLIDAGDERHVHISRIEGAPGPVHLLLSTPDPGRTLESDDGDDDDAFLDDVTADDVTADDPAADDPAADDLPVLAEPSAAEDQTPEEPASPTEPPVMLDLFAAPDAPDQDASVPAKRRAAAPRQRKPRTPSSDVLGLFDEPEE